MILKDFNENFICKNSIIRLWYPDKGGHKLVIPDDKKSVCMEWELNRHSVYKKYANNNVIGITDIVTNGSFPEAINIVIEEIFLDKLREDKLNNLFNL